MAESRPMSRHARPRAAVVCGPPGVGKTTVAELVARRLDADILRTDVIRKELRPEPAYTDEEDRRVYDEMLTRARGSLAAGTSVVLDGTFRDAEHRRRARDVASRLDADFTLLRIECEPAVVGDRIESRTDDASDADFEVYQEFRDAFDPVSMDHVTVDNSHGIERTTRQVERHVRRHVQRT